MKGIMLELSQPTIAYKRIAIVFRFHSLYRNLWGILHNLDNSVGRK
jgi:hypothetical protein